MGRYMGKRDEKLEEIVVDDNKIRTRANFSKVVTTTPYNVYDLRNRRRRCRRMNNFPVISPVTCPTETTSFEENCSEVIVSSSNFPVSCCSSNFSSSSSSSSGEIVKNCGSVTTSGIAKDLEVEVESSCETSSKLFFVDCRKAVSEVETSKLDDEPESDGVHFSTKKSTVEVKPMMIMPSESEIDDFFSSAEKDLQKRFSNKYNFDIVKDVPLEGRYEWVEIKP